MRLFTILFLLFIFFIQISKADFPDINELSDHTEIRSTLKILEEESANGNQKAQYQLGKFYYKNEQGYKNLEKAEKWLKVGAHDAISDSYFQLGSLYFFAQQKYQAAIEVWEKGAALEQPLSLFNLSVIYRLGEVTEKDMTRSLDYLHRSAATGYGQANYNLGLYYAKGKYVEKNFAKARLFLDTALRKGYTRANLALGKLYHSSKTGFRDLELAKIYYELAMKAEIPEAFYRIGWMLENGEAMPQNLENAKKHYQMAARRGYKKAQKAISNISKKIELELEKEKIAHLKYVETYKKNLLSGPSETYKDFQLIGSKNSNIRNKSFFKNTIKAIDLIAELPQEYQNIAGHIDTIIYDPPHADRLISNDHHKDIIGVYHHFEDLAQPNIVIIYTKMLYTAPYQIAASLLGNGVYASDHKRFSSDQKLIADIIKGKEKPTEEEIEALNQRLTRLQHGSTVPKDQLQQRLRSNCYQDQIKLDAMKIWDLPSSTISALQNDLVMQRCYSE